MQTMNLNSRWTNMRTRYRVSRCVLTCFATIIALLFAAYLSHVLAQGSPPTRYVMLVVDRSLSVHRLGPEAQAGSQVMQRFLDRMQRVDCPGCWMGAIAFAEEVTQVVELQSLGRWNEGSMDALLSPPQLGSGTNFVEAIERASDVLRSVPAEGNVERRIVLLTDTQLDEETYQNQAEDLERMIRAELMPAGIQLMVIDYARNGGSEEWWDRVLISRTGGWYMRHDFIGADESVVKTLCWAASIPSESVTLQEDSVQRSFDVVPYQRQIQTLLSYGGDISVTIHSPAGDERKPRDRGNGQVDLIVDNPMEGKWSISVSGSGTFKLHLPPISIARDIELAVSDLRHGHQALPVGTPVQVEFILRDKDEIAFIIVDDRFQVSAQLVDDKGSVQGALDVLFDRSCSCYRATRQNVAGLEGQYFIDAQATTPWLSAPVVANRLSVFWGRVPRFSGVPWVNSPDLKVGQAFSVTVNLADLDTIAHPPHVQLQVAGSNSSLLAVEEMRCRQNTCYADVPALALPGTYTLTAVSYGGSTKEHVDYADTISAVPVVVRHLTLWEFVNRHKWRILAIAAAVAVVLLCLIRVFRRFQLLAELAWSRVLRDPAQQRVIYTRIRQEARSRGGRKE